MNKLLQVMTVAFVVVYAVSPADALPGPVDDAAVLVMGSIMESMLQKRKNKRGNM